LSFARSRVPDPRPGRGRASRRRGPRSRPANASPQRLRLRGLGIVAEAAHCAEAFPARAGLIGEAPSRCGASVDDAAWRAARAIAGAASSTMEIGAARAGAGALRESDRELQARRCPPASRQPLPAKSRRRTSAAARARRVMPAPPDRARAACRAHSRRAAPGRGRQRLEEVAPRARPRSGRTAALGRGTRSVRAGSASDAPSSSQAFGTRCKQPLLHASGGLARARPVRLETRNTCVSTADRGGSREGDVQHDVRRSCVRPGRDSERFALARHLAAVAIDSGCGRSRAGASSSCGR
jgi:hypothetical protein